MLSPMLSHHQGKWCKTMKITAGFDLYHTRINNGALYRILITGGPRLLCNPHFCTQLTNKHSKLSHSGAVKLSPEMYFVSTKGKKGQSQWPHGLRRGSAAARLLWLRVWIPPGAWMFLSLLCCQVAVSLTGQSHVQRSFTECGVFEGTATLEP